MYINIFLSLTTLFFSNFLQEILSIENNAILAYRQLILDKKDNDNKFTNFCLNNNQKTLAYVCYRAYEQIRRNHPYSDVYFHPIFTDKHPECFEESVETENMSSVIQNVKECPGGPIILETYSKSTYTKLHKSTLVFALTLQNIFIFQKKESENSIYSVSDWFVEPEYSFNVESKTSPIFSDDRVIPATIFSTYPPRSIDLTKYNNDYTEIISSSTIHYRNIVHKSNADNFAKLCMIALRRAKYPDVIVDVISHAEQKPKITDVEVEIEKRLFSMKSRRCLTYKMVAHFTINELQQIFSQEEVKKLTSFKIKDDILGYELSPEDIKEALNLNSDMLNEKMDKIVHLLKVIPNRVTYLLSQGQYNHPVILIKGTKAGEESMKYVVVEAIKNIEDEYVERMDLNNETKFLLKLQKS